MAQHRPKKDPQEIRQADLPRTPSTAEQMPDPSSVVSPDGLPRREPTSAEALAAEQEDRKVGDEDGPPDAPAKDPAPHLHPGPSRQEAPLRNAMMSDEGETPSNAGRFALVIGIIVAVGIILWIL